jgi:hypothetical protein
MHRGGIQLRRRSCVRRRSNGVAMKLVEVLGIEVGIGVATHTDDSRDPGPGQAQARDRRLDEEALDTTCERTDPPERFRVCRACSGSGEAGDGPLSFCSVCRGSGRIAE